MKKIGFVISLLLLIVAGAFAATESEEATAIAQKLALDTAKLRYYKDNKLYLEDINHQDWNLNYFSDDNSLYYINFLENSTSEMLLQNVKKERLEYLYERQKKASFLKAVPDAGYLIALATSGDFKRSMISLAGTALSAYKNYKLASEELDAEYLKELWSLTDEQKRIIDEGYNEFRNYFTSQGITYVNSFTSDRLDYFIKVCENETPATRLTQLKKLEKEFSGWSAYWYQIASTCFELSEYSACKDACKKYFDTYVKVLQIDDEYCKMLMEYAFCLDTLEEDSEEKYNELAAILGELEKNHSYEDYVTEYYICMTYIELGSKTGNKDYFVSAYDILLDLTVNELAEYRDSLTEYVKGEYSDQFKSSYEDTINELKSQIQVWQKNKKNYNWLNDEYWDYDEKISSANTTISNIESTLSYYNLVLLPPSSTLLLTYWEQLYELAGELGKTDDVYLKVLLDDIKSALWTLEDEMYIDTFDNTSSNYYYDAYMYVYEKEGSGTEYELYLSANALSGLGVSGAYYPLIKYGISSLDGAVATITIGAQTFYVYTYILHPDDAQDVNDYVLYFYFTSSDGVPFSSRSTSVRVTIADIPLMQENFDFTVYYEYEEKTSTKVVNWFKNL